VVAVVPIGAEAATAGLALSRRLALAGLTAPAEVTGRSLKAGLKWAGKIGARAVVILGESEMRDGTAIVRDLAKGEQEVVELEGVVECARRMVAELADG
jgi:histidyl-tRNA synthetase